MIIKFLPKALFTIAIMLVQFKVAAQFSISAESGAVFTGYNNVRIAGNSGTLFSLKDELKPEANAFIRLRAGYTIASRHTISLLYAPLTVKSSGTINQAVDFNGVLFAANTKLNSSYTFNSYRITYRYDIVKRDKIEFGLGFTAKIRDAEISLEGNGIKSSKTNVGFVPIINFRLFWKMNDQFGLLFEGDALAAPQGRAEDVRLAVTYRLAEKLQIQLGYRLLEGGADNDEVYNFSMFNYASIGATYTFGK